MARYLVKIVVPKPGPERREEESALGNHILEASDLSQAMRSADELVESQTWGSTSYIQIFEGGHLVASRHANERWNA